MATWPWTQTGRSPGTQTQGHDQIHKHRLPPGHQDSGSNTTSPNPVLRFTCLSPKTSEPTRPNSTDLRKHRTPAEDQATHSCRFRGSFLHRHLRTLEMYTACVPFQARSNGHGLAGKIWGLEKHTMNMLLQGAVKIKIL